MKKTDFMLPFLKKALSFLEKILGPLDQRVPLNNFKNPKFNLFIGIIFLIFWFGLNSFFASSFNQNSTELPKKTRVQVVESHAQNKINYHTFQGHLEALNKVTLKAETAGIVKNISVEKGLKVHGGQEIMLLSFKARLAQLKEATALVAQRRLEYNNALKLQSNNFRSKTSVAEAKSKLEAAQAALESIQTEIEDTKIRAPFEGAVDRRYVQPGDYVQAGDSLVDFISFDPILAITFVPENTVPFLRQGTKALIECQGEALIGNISFISKIADPLTRSYRVEVTLPNPAGNMFDGLTVTVKIPVNQALAHFVSPAAIAMDDQGVPGIKTVGAEHKVHFYPINLLSHEEKGIWVAGLPKEALIITTGQYYVKVGEIVDPIITSSEDDPKKASTQNIITK